MEKNVHQRRQFLKQTLALSAGAAVLPFASHATVHNNEGNGTTFLFQGDSITDGNRTRNNDWNHVMGHGFAYLIASRVWYDFPAKQFHFFNRGISGNKINDLAERWQPDTLDLKPAVLSILVGINDLDTFINGNSEYTKEKYEEGYRALLQRTKTTLPNVQLVLCEPFILPVGRIKDKWDLYSNEIKSRQEIVKRLAAEFNAIFVPCQSAFDKALQKAPAEYWIWDGIHPMPAGHELMAREWIKIVGKQLKFIL
ncbi:SGNH/GDSL hydrolase family protein [soil metagenome]